MSTLKEQKAVVMLSGGQDSVTVLAYAAERHGKENIHPIHFSYGQKHAIEKQCAINSCDSILGSIHNTVLTFKVPFLEQLNDSALLKRSSRSINSAHHHDKNLPASFVPNRNAAFLTIAHAYAIKIGASSVYGGMCETDYSGYPDCRDSFVTSLNNALNLGSPKNVLFITPLMFMSKASTFKLAEDLGVLDTVLEHTNTCYNGARDEGLRREWGYGCGSCPACAIRRTGWEEYVQERTNV